VKWPLNSSVRRLGVALAVLPAMACGAGPDSLVLRGGAVYTVDAARSWASAVAIRGGRIVYVGGDSLPPP
jgi:hypothetical protein